MSDRLFGKREKHRIAVSTLQTDIETARHYFSNGSVLEAIDIYEQLAVAYPTKAIAILAELYDCYEQLPNRDRYSLYQSRHFDFGIVEGDKVLDIGSGHLPFPLATHLADIAVTDHAYGRAGTPFKYIDGKPVYECGVESMPFSDKEFDFVYCSHVLEHTTDPEKACQELMRIGKRGYIETPTKGKDVFFNSAKISNHKRSVEIINGQLVFTEYTPEEVEGLQCDILLQMNCHPQTEREKAFAALMILKAEAINSMLLWDNTFKYEIRGKVANIIFNESDNMHKSTIDKVTAINRTDEIGDTIRSKKLIFLQIIPLYRTYLADFYNNRPYLHDAPFCEQIRELYSDGFGAVHILAPYLFDLNYDSHMVISNDIHSQVRWLKENSAVLEDTNNWMFEIVKKQIDLIKPDIVYFLDPVTYDCKFYNSLSWKPSLVIGYKASDIPPNTDWSNFDVILSPLAALRSTAIKLGAKSAVNYAPGFAFWLHEKVESFQPQLDVAFTGSWTVGQHAHRNAYLESIAQASTTAGKEFSCGFFLSGQVDTIPPVVAQFNYGGRFGLAMYQALRIGKIAIDARGSLELKKGLSNETLDVAGKETANMRIFEATGCGAFLLTEHFDNLSCYFEPGKEIETFNNERELIDKIHYFLSHPVERNAIAQRGFEKCKQDYNMEKKAKEFDAIIQNHLAKHHPPPIYHAKPQTKIPEFKTTEPDGYKQLTNYFDGVTFGVNVQVIGIKNISIGNGTCIGDDTWLNVALRDDKLRMKIGKSILIGRHSVISTGGYLEMGDYCLLGPHVYISDANHVFDDIYKPVFQQGVTTERHVTIEENCWLGINSVINGNLTVGRGSIIGANSVVTKDVSPFSIVAGNPAKIIKMYNHETNSWEKISSDEDICNIERIRQRIGMPTREEYRAIVAKNATFSKVQLIVGGHGICI